MRFILSLLISLSLLCTCSRTGFLPVDAVALSTPAITTDDYFFTGQTRIHVGATQAGSAVHYTKGLEVPTKKSPVTKGVIEVTASQRLHFRSIGGGYLPSAVRTIEVLQLHPTAPVPFVIASANPPYDQAPTSVLTDQKKGSENFRDGKWLGYQDSVLVFELGLPDTPIKQIGISVLVDHRSWLFAPSRVKATFFAADGSLVGAQESRIPVPVKAGEKNFRFVKMACVNSGASSVRLEVHTLATIPDWHPGKGQKPWLFIDELLFL